MKNLLLFFLCIFSFQLYAQIPHLETVTDFRINSASNPGRTYTVTSTGRQDINATNDLVTSAGGAIEFRPNVIGLPNRGVVIKNANGPAFFTAFAPNESVGIGTGILDPKSKLHVSGGDVYIQDVNSGVIMPSPDGNCWRLNVGNGGTLSITPITCP